MRCSNCGTFFTTSMLTAETGEKVDILEIEVLDDSYDTLELDLCGYCYQERLNSW